MDYALGLLRLMRPRNAIGPLIGCAVGYYACTSHPTLHTLSTPLILVFLMSGIATIQNDIADFEIDKFNKRTGLLFDRADAIAKARIFALLLICVACGLAVFGAKPAFNMAFIAVCLVLSYLYNFQPFVASRRPIASILTLATCLGFAPVLYGSLLSANIGLLGGVLAISWFLQRASLGILKDFKDLKGDKHFAKSTFLIRYGRSMTINCSLVLSIGGFIFLLSALYPNSDYRFLALVPFAAYIIFRRWQLRNIHDAGMLNSAFMKATITQNIFDAGVLLCLCI